MAKRGKYEFTDGERLGHAFSMLMFAILFIGYPIAIYLAIQKIIGMI